MLSLTGMNIEELASQETKYIFEYADAFGLPRDFSAAQIVNLITSAFKEVPFLPHLIYKVSESGKILITGEKPRGQFYNPRGEYDPQPDAVEPEPSSALPRRRVLVRGAPILRAYLYHQERLTNLAQNAALAFEPTGTVPLGPTHPSASSGMTATPLPSDINSNEATSGNQNGPSASVRMPNAPSPPSPHKRTASPDDGNDEDDAEDDNASVRDSSPAPFPTIDFSVSSGSPPASPKSQHSVPPPPPPQPSAPRFTYPPNVNGDWLDIMLNDLKSGRIDVQTALERAKQELRLAVESVMKAHMELRAENEEWNGFKNYLAEIVGPDWIETLEEEAKRMQENGSDLGSDDEEGDEADGGDEDGDDGGDDEGDDEANNGADGNGGQNDVDESSDDSFDVVYQTPLRPPKIDPAARKRRRDDLDALEDPDHKENADLNTTPSSKRAKFSHVSSCIPSPPSGSDNDEKEFLPCSARPPTPRPKRPRSPSTDSDEEEEVERSVKRLARDDRSWNIDTQNQPATSASAHIRRRTRESRTSPQHASDLDLDITVELYRPPPVSVPGLHYNYDCDPSSPSAVQSVPSSVLGFLGRIFSLSPSQAQTQSSVPSTSQLQTSPSAVHHTIIHLSSPESSPEDHSQTRSSTLHHVMRHFSPEPSPDLEDHLTSLVQSDPHTSGPEPGPSDASQSYDNAKSDSLALVPVRGTLPAHNPRPLTRQRSRVYENSDPELRYQVHRYGEGSSYEKFEEWYQDTMGEQEYNPHWKGPRVL
ncbi:hypothetical protein H0H92_002855 [Tricholoma furcatifolium]|nr:hypothetical protein H0H92_002855 [Tricholoma furcatifolium]